MRFRLIVIICILAFCACNNEDIDTPGFQITSSDHFPLEQGHWVDYEVLEISFSSGGADRDTGVYYLREEISGTTIDATGNTLALVDRYVKYTKDGEWIYQETWAAGIVANEAIRIEGSLRFVKLVLPARNAEEWDGNKYFDPMLEVDLGSGTIQFYKNWRSKYMGINETVKVDNIEYTHVHRIQLADSENLIERRFGVEYYAQDIGLIYRELMILDTQCFEACAGQDWEEKAEVGLVYVQSVIDHK